jgi:alpha-L-rhamnosidase
MENRFPAEEDRGHLQISQWGDHLATADGSASRANMPLSIATAFYYLDVAVMTDIAKVLGHKDDAVEYQKLSEEIKNAYNERFYDSALGYYDTGVQSAQAWALAFGLVPDDERKRVENYFTRMISQTQRRLTTGYAGTKYAINALSKFGHDDMVWKLATSTDFPSWGYMLRLNRTTSCERWDGEGGSLNHAPLGAAIDEWFYSGLAGIQPDVSGPGFEKIIFKPYIPKDLPWVKSSLETARGTIASEWKHDGTTATMEITVPGNSTATVYIPVDDPGKVTESGEPATKAEGVSLLETNEDETLFKVGSGIYKFEFPIV